MMARLFTASGLLLIGLSAAIWLIVIPPIGSWLIPGSWFLTIHRMVILDGPAGSAPEAAIERTIHVGFRGERVIDVQRVTPDGFAPHCTRRIVEPLPFTPKSGSISVNLDAWMDIPPNAPCTWPAGQYIATTEWTIFAPFLRSLGITPSVRQDSMFTLTDPTA